MKCVACNHDNRLGIKFCENCGNQLPQAQAKEATGKFCSNCGQSNPLNTSFCSNCGQNFTVILKSQKTKTSFGKSIVKLGSLFIGVFIVTYLALNILGIIQTFKPGFVDQTAKAEILAIEFVQQNYPELVNADRSAYVANIQGTDFYVVDFILNDPSKPPMGARILVDRFLRAIFTYELIEG